MKIAEILKDSNYKLTQFKDKYIKELEKSIFTKKLKSGEAPYIKCLVRKKDIKLTPEEIVRQLYLYKLYFEYNYPFNRVAVEYPISFGRDTKRADIVIFDKVDSNAYILLLSLKNSK